MGLADMAVAGNRQKEETTPTFYDIRQTTTTLSQRKINWFGESSRLLEFDRPLTEPGASKLTKVFLATRTAVWNQVSGAPRHRRDIATVTASARRRGDSTPSTRYCPRNCVCSMAWRFTG